MRIFKSYLIDGNTDIDNVYELFFNAFKHYADSLRVSIDVAIRNGSLPDYGNPIFYTYLIMDGTKLQEILNVYSISSITNQKVDEFCENVLYGGKGKLLRKFEHAIAGKPIISKQLPFKKISAKLSKISQIWERGHGITVL